MHRSSDQPSFVDQMIGPGRSRSDKFFGAVDQAVDWKSIEDRLQSVYASPTGRPSHPPLMLFKVLLIQRWYNLSDPAVEDALNDRKSFARFVGLGLDQSAPDHSVISRFRSQLVRLALMQPLVDELHRQIEARGLILKQGTLLDATLVGSAARPPAAPRRKTAAKAASKPPADPFTSGKLSRVDPDARWTRKGAKAGFGYKLHLAVDDERRFVRGHIVTPANRNDCELGPDLVQPDGGAHYADKGYSSQPIRKKLSALNLPDGVMQLGNKHHPLPPAHRRRNRLLARLRSRVEGVFGEMKRNFGLARTRYLGLPKVTLDCDLAVFAFNLKTFALASKIT
jgi:IS5 family transposase